jgi:hypothetical protein
MLMRESTVETIIVTQAAVVKDARELLVQRLSTVS